MNIILISFGNRFCDLVGIIWESLGHHLDIVLEHREKPGDVEKLKRTGIQFLCTARIQFLCTARRVVFAGAPVGKTTA